jgi:hypothetical protein
MAVADVGPRADLSAAAMHDATAASIACASNPLASILAGVPILIVSRLLNFIVSGYPIAVGMLGLLVDMRIR